ncbi:MAG: hypothetical protein R3F14_02045 [Polyangiaceae bacterium]
MSPAICGLVLMKLRVKVCVTVGATQAARHYDVHLAEVGVRTARDDVGRAVRLAVEHDAEEALISLARPSMNSRAFWQLLHRLRGEPDRDDSTGTGRAVLSSGKRPFVMYCLRIAAPAEVDSGVGAGRAVGEHDERLVHRLLHVHAGVAWGLLKLPGHRVADDAVQHARDPRVRVARAADEAFAACCFDEVHFESRFDGLVVEEHHVDDVLRPIALTKAAATAFACRSASPSSRRRRPR